MKLSSFLLCTLPMALLIAPGTALSQERPFYLAVSGGIGQVVGPSYSVVRPGPVGIVGVGGKVSPHVAVEGEFVGHWANVNAAGASGSIESYAGIVGPRFFTGDRFGVYAGAGIGLAYGKIQACIDFVGCGSRWETQFAWQAKAGIEFAISESLQLVTDVRYGAMAKYSDEGIVAGTVGLRFYPGW